MVAGWIREGLPSDPTSVQNGCILTSSERWPLLMDPQLQGVVWVKEREARNNLQVGRFGLVFGRQSATMLCTTRPPKWEANCTAGALGT